MTPLRRIDIIEQLSDKHGIKTAQARHIVDDVLDSIGGAIGAGRRVELRRIGTFRSVSRRVSTRFTNGPVNVPAVRFRAGKQVLTSLKRNFKP